MVQQVKLLPRMQPIQVPSLASLMIPILATEPGVNHEHNLIWPRNQNIMYLNKKMEGCKWGRMPLHPQVNFMIYYNANICATCQFGGAFLDCMILLLLLSLQKRGKCHCNASIQKQSESRIKPLPSLKIKAQIFISFFQNISSET